MSNLSIQEAQSVLLNLFKIADELCRKHNIEYWIDGGTLLGARRNGEFIPWDDDLDLCFLPDDFYRFQSLMREEVFPEQKHLFFYNDARPFPHYSEYFADTRYLRNGHYPLKIDIILVKSLPNNSEIIKRDESMVSFVHFFKFFKFKDLNKVFPADIAKYLKNPSGLLVREYYIKELISYGACLNEKNNNHLYSYIYNDMYVAKEREYYTYEDIFPLKEIDFEGISAYCPNNTDSYLTILYGEHFIQPPPKNQQQPFADKIQKSNTPVFLRKKIVYILYYLKSIMNAWRVRKALKKLNL